MKHKKLQKFSLFPSLVLSLALASCTTVTSHKKPDPDPDVPKAEELVMETLHIGLRPDAELGLTDFDAPALFHEGLRLHEADRCADAIKFYDRIVSDFPESRYISAASYNAGRCLEVMEQHQQALTRYLFITTQLTKSKDWIDAMFRQAACQKELGQKAQVSQTLIRLLKRAELGVSDRIDATVLLGESLAARGELLKAEQTLRQALRLFRKHERQEYLDPAPAARAEFNLGLLAAGRFELAPLRLPEKQMRIDLENKAQALLSAQAVFLRSMRYGDPEWATAAGYQVGQLYLTLHQAMESSAAPEDLSPDEALIYRELLRKRLAVLLRKALRIFEMTLQLAERTGSDNEWTRAARQEMERVEKEVLSLLEELPAPQKNPEDEIDQPQLPDQS